jgi:hypothetical protein
VRGQHHVIELEDGLSAGIADGRRFAIAGPAGWSMRPDDLGKLSGVGPHQGMAGTINQAADSAGYPAHQHFEVMSGDAGIVCPSNDQCRCFDLVQPGAAIEGDEPSHGATHGRGAIGRQYGLHPFGLLPSGPILTFASLLGGLSCEC